MPWDPETPYVDLPLLPPRVELETRAVLKATISARASLATLAQAAQLLPNPTVLINAVPLLEAQASSEIENIVTTADELFKHSSLDGGDHATKEALRYRAALFAGVDAIRSRPLTADTAAQVCTRIHEREMSVRKVPGTRIANPTSGAIIYSPPEGADIINAMLQNWERFVHATDDLDPLVRMAVAHYQFEAIHPFHDGNGRTGRILNILMLIAAGLLADPVLYLSRYIIGHKNEYYRLLNEVTAHGAWEAWILYMLDAVRESAESTVRKIAAIRECQATIADEARAATVGGRDSEFLAALFEQPYCRITDVVTRCDVTRQTASGWLRALVDAGVLGQIKVGREHLFVNGRFLEVLIRTE